MARKMDQTEERQIPRVMFVAIGNGAEHHYEVHDMHLNRVWINKDQTLLGLKKVPFVIHDATYRSVWESIAEADIGKDGYWMPRA